MLQAEASSLLTAKTELEYKLAMATKQVNSTSKQLEEQNQELAQLHQQHAFEIEQLKTDAAKVADAHTAKFQRLRQLSEDLIKTLA